MFMVVLQTLIGFLNQLNVVILSQADGGGHVDGNLKKLANPIPSWLVEFSFI